MKKNKKDNFYYKNLCSCIEYSYDAALLLKNVLEEFNENELEEKMDVMHVIEQKADMKKHKMTEALSCAFITPLEREDLMSLSNYLDDITDAIEDILLQIYMCNIREVREDLFPMLELLIKIIRVLDNILKELKNFKQSKEINGYIIKVNDLEEEGDKLYAKCMRNLHMENDLKTILIWRKIYECVENCIDTCEDVADVIAMIMMKNS